MIYGILKLLNNERYIMTKKHYQIIADAIRKAVLTTITEEDDHREVILGFLNSNLLPTLIEEFIKDNERFDAFKFVDAIRLVKN